MERLVVIGSIYPNNFLSEVQDCCTYIDYAADNFQRGLLKGLGQYVDKIRIITYPIFKAPCKMLLKKGRSVSNGFPNNNSCLYFTGFYNFPIIKKIDETVRIYKELKHSLSEGYRDILVYGLHSPFLLPVFLLQKRIKKAMIIVTDLPEYMGGGQGALRRVAKKIDRHIINRCLGGFNSFAILSPFMKEELPIHNKPTIVVEGIYSQISEGYKEKHNTNETIVLYTGIISERYGVFDLVEAFAQIKQDNYQLWLCGYCDTPHDKELLQNYESIDNRIKYFGAVSASEARSMQQKASLLVNPRHSGELFTKFSFPSKTMEYLASGTPTLMCRLPSIPQEYDDYLFYFDDESINGYASKIIEVTNIDHELLNERGKAGREFILKNKNEKVQAKKILDLLTQNDGDGFKKSGIR